ncbi:hypothetical protein Aca07nite_38910 [Actinoplanes capillaceus]|uniref:Hedgehog/Intein (Hint) domain-containing protein n=1 Tax=Actinoplanes campanulatus TaxID=113559 RepID=A0ABQ3WK49_9ACTN|nr:hypothetical protein [Actinoplanes capillaceus]GID46616.1 hypothetical protein Aca07nite_38910 [Actinoplanes capillaceus]
MKISAPQADELTGNSWFSGHTDGVELHEAPVTVDEFDAEARCEERDELETAVFGGGLTVAGTLDLGTDVHAIYVVRGTLRARRLILGDAVLVVDGAVEVDEWLFGGVTEGLFEVAGHQAESPTGPNALLAHVRGPVVALYDRARREFVLREGGSPRTVADLVPQVRDGLDPDLREEISIAANLRARLIAGGPIF